MTLQGSFPISSSDINEELGRSGSALWLMRGTNEMYLADKSSGAVSMSDFLGKLAIKQTAITSLSAMGTSHSFSGVDLGPNGGSGTCNVVLVFGMSKNSSDTSGALISGATIAGVAADTHTNWWQGGSSSTQLTMTGRLIAPSAAASGTISFTTAGSCRCLCVVFYVMGSDGTFAGANADNDESASATGLSASINVQSNGLVFAAATKANGNAMSFSGVTERGGQSPLTGYHIGWGFDNKQSTQTGKSFSFSSSGSAMCAFRAFSMNPAAAA